MSSLDVALKGLAEDSESDLLFMADASRSAADIGRAIATAKAAGFTVYQRRPAQENSARRTGWCMAGMTENCGSAHERPCGTRGQA
jgi:hypothetical protein